MSTQERVKRLEQGQQSGPLVATVADWMRVCANLDAGKLSRADFDALRFDAGMLAWLTCETRGRECPLFGVGGRCRGLSCEGVDKTRRVAEW